MTTTSYGFWQVDGTASPRDYIVASLGEWGRNYDVDAITEALRDLLREELPEGIVLTGNEFLGPHPMPEGYSVNDRVKQLLDNYEPFWDFVARHDWSKE